METQGCTNHREMRKRLRKVTNLQPGFGIIFFAEETDIVTQCEQTVKQGVCFCDTTLHLVHVDEPETAREKNPFSGRQPIRAAFRLGSANTNPSEISSRSVAATVRAMRESSIGKILQLASEVGWHPIPNYRSFV